MRDAVAADAVAPVPDDDVRIDRTAFLGVTLGLGLVGGIAAAYGTFLSGIAHRYSLSVATSGVTLTANFVGALLGVGAAWWALRRAEGRHVLVGSLVVLAAGLLAAALAPSWPAFLAAVAVGGIGFGGLDLGIVALVARTHAVGRATRLSVSGSGWAFGAIVGPLAIAAMTPARFGVFLVGAAGCGLILTATLRGVAASPVHPDATATMRAARAANRRAVLYTFLAGFACYVALETSVAGWIASDLHGARYTAAVGSLVTAGFWAGLAVGRLLAGRLSARVTGQGLVLLGLALAAVLLLGATSHTVALACYPLCGFALAAVFPLGLHWFTELSPDDHSGVAWLVLIDMVGGILGSGAQNLAVASFGLHVVPVVAAGFAVLCLVLFASARRFGTPEPR